MGLDVPILSKSIGFANELLAQRWILGWIRGNTLEKYQWWGVRRVINLIKDCIKTNWGWLGNL